MKRAIRNTVLWLVFLCGIGSAHLFSQNPTYTLTITNDSLSSPNMYDFDIYLLRTGELPFEYANNSQYFISVNPAIKNGGVLSFSILPGTCELHGAQQIQSGRVSFDNTKDRLQIITHTPTGAGTGTIISHVSPGTRLGRFRLSNTVQFGDAKANLQWINSQQSFQTKVFGYRNNANIQITTPVNHFVLTSDPLLPVELTSFTSSVTGNGIELQWETATEVNNYGFELERRVLASAIRYVGDKTEKGETEWRKIAFIEGAGTSASPHTYKYVDPYDGRGRLAYRLKQIDHGGLFRYVGSTEAVIELSPKDYGLSQNYPNPFNPTTTFRFAVRTPQRVSSRVYDLLGRQIITLFDEEAEAHVLYIVTFDASMLSTGVYLSVLQTAEGIHVKKMMLVR